MRSLGFYQKDGEERKKVLHTSASLVELDFAGIEVVRYPDAEIVAIELIAELMLALFPPVFEFLGHRVGR